MTRSQLLVRTAPDATARYSVSIAGSADEVRAAQRLRHAVFAGELGARLSCQEPGVDCDGFDDLCDHLVVHDDSTGEIVGCYRMLPPGRSARLYADGEFDLTALAGLRPTLVEAGRSCVHPGHRTGAVMSLMWAGIARYQLLSGHRWLAGCASVPTADAGGVWARVAVGHLAPARYRVRPYSAAPLSGPEPAPEPAPPAGVRLPPLLRGYLRLGAWVCGEPALDTEFGVADLFVLLSMDRVDPRYLRFFLGEDGR